MENLEKQCLEKLDKILSKFDLAINIVNIPSIECQYRLVDNSLSKTFYSDWLGLWISLNDLLFHHQSIFKCLESYYDVTNSFNFLSHIPYNISSTYKRYSKAYQFIQPLKSSCLEEFIIKCDLVGI